MSLAQLEYLGKTLTTDPSIIGASFRKRHAEKLSEENQLTWSNDEKYNNFIILLSDAQNEKMPEAFQMTLLRQILILGPSVN
jgi:hypothetical protein